MKRRFILGIAVIVLLLAACLWYTRPVTISQRYPMLSTEDCTRVHGYVRQGTGEERPFSFEPDSVEYEALCSLVFDRSYRRSLRDLLPKGTRTHRIEPGDTRWRVDFDFENVKFSDGSTGTGTILGISDWYGQLEVTFEGNSRFVTTRDQTAWSADVLSVITGESVVFEGRLVKRSQLSPETLEWLAWYNSLPAADREKISFVPPELNAQLGHVQAEETAPAS